MVIRCSSPIFWTPPGARRLPAPQEEGVVLTTEEREETSEEPGPPGWKTPINGTFRGKTMEKPWKKHGKTWDMPMINGGFYGPIIYQWWIFQHA